MPSITLLSLAPTATLLHLPAPTSSSSFTAAPRPLLRALPPRRVTVVCSAAAAAPEAEHVEKFRLVNLGPQKGSRRRPKRIRQPGPAEGVAAAAEADSSTWASRRGRGGGRSGFVNLGPQKGSRRWPKRKGRGIAAGQGARFGFGMRGQKSHSGPVVRRGFEGGQVPLYRRLPKLRGIAGGMHIGLPKYVPFNLKGIARGGFKDGDEISLESLKSRGLVNLSARERKLRLKVF